MIIPERHLKSKSKMLTFFSKNNKRIFLDYASTTPLDDKVKESMREAENYFANPSSLYKEGVEARSFLDDSRDMVAETLGCKAKEVIFTASGTESCNLAVRGTVKDPRNDHMVTTTIEHPAILESFKALEAVGLQVTYVDVDEDGIVPVQKILDSIQPNTKLVSVMYVNNEIGTIQPIRDLGVELEKLRNRQGIAPYLHTDASQAPCYLNVSPQSLKVDMLTLDGSKMYGPKGSGLLFRRIGLDLDPIIYGGGQESGLRSGTEDNVRIRGIAKALQLASQLRASEYERVEELSKELRRGVKENIPSAVLNGSSKKRSPHINNFCVPGTDSEFLVVRMDSLGCACSSSSACRSLKKGAGSHVLEAIGKKECASSSLRLSLGRYSTISEVRCACELLGKAVNS